MQRRIMRLGGILKQSNPMLISNRLKLTHRRWMPIQMHRHNRLSTLRNRRLSSRGIHTEIVSLNINKHRRRTSDRHRVRRRRKRKRRTNHLITRTNTRRKKRQMQGRSTRIHRNSKHPINQSLRKLLLKSSHLRTLRHHPRPQNSRNSSNLILTNNRLSRWNKI